MSEFNDSLHDLTRRINKLRSVLRHNQFRHNIFILKHSKNANCLVLNEYEKSNSLIKSANAFKLDKSNPVDVHVKGQNDSSEFREFHDEINTFNNKNSEVKKEKDYTLKNVESSWIYTTVVNGEKISLISSDYERLCGKIKKRNLPFDT